MIKKKPVAETTLTAQAALDKDKRIADLTSALNFKCNELRILRNQLTKLAGAITTALGE